MSSVLNRRACDDIIFRIQKKKKRRKVINHPLGFHIWSEKKKRVSHCQEKLKNHCRKQNALLARTRGEPDYGMYSV